MDFSGIGSFGSCLDDFSGKYMSPCSCMYHGVDWSNDFSNGNPRFYATSDGGYPSNIVITMAMTEDGSKFLLELLSSKDSRVSNLIFSRVFEFIFELMIHQFGRYLFQQLIVSVDEIRLQMIMEKLTVAENHIYHASVHKYGNFSVKKLITALKRSPLITYVIKALSNKFEELMTDPTGQYVILECLDVLDSRSNDLLYVRAMEGCLELSRHVRGVVSMNAFIARIKGPRLDQLLNWICDNVRFLAQDPTGNYVVQCVIGLENPAINDRIFSLLEGLYVKLSMAKAGSHLVEQCLRLSGMKRVISEFIGSDQLVFVVKDRYGNYVVQTALKESKKRDARIHASLIVKLEERLDCLRHGYGRNIRTLFKSLQ
ncbi:pumilio 12 [Hibiscus trionum]|uniref:Pumilio 12 n=1 Tax=Hibiscus trionum TaxID=183268 RepID=A0A9W7IZ41_HIBTR|nr:pumilio 12 [Hibiscus trionum]GMJ02519.1 pumilio 12 [Hibiscus trionum]